MNETSEYHNNVVALASGDTPQATIRKGFDELGGISNLINENDIVFIKVNLRVPELFPVNFNFDSLTQLINLCKNAGAQKIIIGSYADEYIEGKAFEQLLGFKSMLETLGVDFQVFQDNMDIEYVTKTVKERSVKIPKVVIDSTKLIVLNQIAVNPLFQIDLSILNSYSIVSPKLEKTTIPEGQGKDYLIQDQYKQDLISNILEIYNIRKPDIVINDLFYLVEQAGPYIFKDSKLKKTNMMVLGTDALTVDIITLSLLNLDYQKNSVIKEAMFLKWGISDIKNIKIVGEPLEESKFNIKLPILKLEDIDVLNTNIKSGHYCSGCFEAVYRYLNFLKTNMIKDLKYIGNQYLLLGENPQEPASNENIILFGDCAIKSTETSSFRKILVEKKSILDLLRLILKKKKKHDTTPKLKERVNKKILELPGCPPNFYHNLHHFIEYYGKNNCPNGVFYLDLLKTYIENETFEGALK